jgi:hypothetical protein
MPRLVRKDAWMKEGQMPLHRAYLRGIGVIFLTVLGAMVVPFIFDLYKVGKNWLLATSEEEQDG